MILCLIIFSFRFKLFSGKRKTLHISSDHFQLKFFCGIIIKYNQLMLICRFIADMKNAFRAYFWVITCNSVTLPGFHSQTAVGKLPCSEALQAWRVGFGFDPEPWHSMEKCYNQNHFRYHALWSGLFSENQTPCNASGNKWTHLQQPLNLRYTAWVLLPCRHSAVHATWLKADEARRIHNLSA